MKPRRVNLSCTVPANVATDLQKIADDEGHLMSRKICKILTDYIKGQKTKHPALSTAKKEAE
jgi:hypothetical protein